MSNSKPGASADHPRPVHVLPIGALKDGQTYEGWHCRGCGLFIALDDSWPEVGRIPDAHFVRAICPQCKTDRVGTWAGREKIQHVVRPGSGNSPT